MRRYSFSEKLLLDEVMQSAQKMKVTSRGLSFGDLIRMIRTQLGMSQKVLSKLSKVPQSTISRIEQGHREVNLSTLSKILEAMFCDLVISPLMLESIDVIRLKQARKIAEKRVRYLTGTMNLEDQQPDPRFIEELLKQEQERLLRGPNAKLWEE